MPRDEDSLRRRDQPLRRRIVLPLLHRRRLYHISARNGKVLTSPKKIWSAPANRATTTQRRKAALPSDAAPDPDFGGPGGMALWQSIEPLASAFAYAHRGEPASPQPCRTAESPLARTSARPGGQSATGAERRCHTRALSRVRRDFDPRARGRALCASVKILSGAPTKCGSGGNDSQRQ